MRQLIAYYKIEGTSSAKDAPSTPARRAAAPQPTPAQPPQQHSAPEQAPSTTAEGFALDLWNEDVPDSEFEPNTRRA